MSEQSDDGIDLLWLHNLVQDVQQDQVDNYSKGRPVNNGALFIQLCVMALSVLLIIFMVLVLA